MMFDFEVRDKALTILVVPHNAETIRGQLADLSKHGLIAPVVLVANDGNAQILIVGAFTVIDLSELLSGVDLATVRVLAVRVNAAPSEQQRQMEEELVARMRRNAEGLPIVFKLFTVTVADAETKFRPAMFHSTWTANIAVIPEESAGGGGYSAQDLKASAVEPVALAAVTLLGGLWHWIDRGTLDTEQSVVIEARSYLRLARIALRIVDAGDLTSRLIGWAMDPGGVWPIPREYVPHDNPQLAIDELAVLVAGSPECRFRFIPYEPKPARKPKGFGPLEAIKLFYSRLWSHMAGLPAQAVANLRNRVARSIEGLVQQATFGQDSAIAVRVGKRPASAAEMTDGLNRIALLSSLKEVTIPAPQGTPEAWQVLRSVAFGAADGGDFVGTLAGKEPLWLNQRSVIDDRQTIAPDPGQPGEPLAFHLEPYELYAVGMTASAPVQLRAFDVLSVQLFRDRLDETLLAGGLDETWTGPPLPAIFTEVPPPVVGDDASVDWGPPTVNGTAAEIDEDDETGEIDDVEPVVYEPPVITKAVVVGSLQERFDLWIRKREDTLLWKLGVSIGEGVDNALADFEQASAAFERVLAEQQAQDAESEKLGRRMRRRSIFAVVVLSLLLLGTVAAFIFVSVTLGLMGVGLVAAATLMLPLVFYRTGRKLTRLEFRLEQLETLPERILNQRRHAAQEAARLTYLQEQLLDWSEIISLVLHRPWGRKASDLGDEPWSAKTGTRVFTTATPEIDPMSLQGEILRLRRHLSRVGWLSTVYTQQLAAWEARYAVLTSGTAGVGTDPSADPGSGRRPTTQIHKTGEPLYRPRTQLRIDLLNDRFADEMRRERVQSLRNNIDESYSPTLLGPVECDIQSLRGKRPGEVLKPIAEQTPIPRFSRFIAHRLGGPSGNPEFSVVGVSPSVQATIPEDETPRRLVDVRGVTERFTLASFRMDFSEPMEVANCELVLIDTEPAPDLDREHVPPPTPPKFG